MEQQTIGFAIATIDIIDESKKLFIKKGSILKVLSFPNKEFTKVKHKNTEDSIIIIDVNNDYLHLICEHCLKEISISKKEEHQSIHHPEITINTYTFKLLYKMENERYIRVKIKNIQQKIDFIIYQSNSHCNLYRFCSILSDKTYYKGDKDYVTETFIHMDLQKFIVENFDNIILKEEEECLYIADDTHLSLKEVKPFWVYIKERQTLFSSEKFLIRITDIKCGEGFSNIYKIIDIINDILRNPREFLPADLITEFNTLIRNILLIFFPKREIKEKDFREEILKLTIELLTKNRSGAESGLEIPDKYKIMRLYLEFISAYMNNKYNILSGYKKLYETNFRMKKYPSKEFRFSFFSVDIQHKENRKIYSVIFAFYNYSEAEGVYSIVLNIIPHNDDGNHINSLGLYKKVISIGIYLCKPLDYSNQFQTLMRDSKEEEYHFVGHLYDSLFPVKEILGR